MTSHTIEKALEVWLLQNLLNFSIILGLLALFRSACSGIGTGTDHILRLFPHFDDCADLGICGGNQSVETKNSEVKHALEM
ncbi:MAG: hypothetical protein GXO75_06285 [Calditrichaeota bacterium]|nr:hypothetical protein [Calditrichota bacterium]